jgi:1-phosphofructokinase
MKFITVTLNPTLDQILLTRFLAIGYHNDADNANQFYPAGRGVNISRALHQLNCVTHTIVLLGNDVASQAFYYLAKQEGLNITTIRVDGYTRSNTIILDTSNNTETHIVGKSMKVTKSDFQNVYDTLKAIISDGDRVIYAGSLPEESPEDSYGRLTYLAHKLGAKVTVASEGAHLVGSLEAKPDLVALRRLECEGIFNRPIRVQDDVIYFAQQLRKQGAQSALIELRNEGSAVFVANEGEWEIDIHDNMSIDGTKVGVWDAMLAGFLANRAKQKPLEKSLKLGAATAAYAADQVGNKFGTPTEIKDYLSEVEVTQV